MKEYLKVSCVNKYLSLFMLSFKRGAGNYKVLLGLSVFLVTCMVIFAYLWEIVVSGNTISTFNADELLWYIAFNQWILVAVPRLHEEMVLDLHSGRLAYLLPRPISYVGAIFAEAAGTLCINLIILGAVTFLFTYTQTTVVPFSFGVFIISLALGCAAGLLMTLFNTLIGLSGFWFHDVEPLYWLWEKSLFMLGGLMMPLMFYPEWLQTLAVFTPFPSILGGRSGLTIEFNSSSLMQITSMLVVWGVLGALCLRYTYRKGLHILNLEGG